MTRYERMYRPLLTFRSTFRGIPPGRALITEQKKKHPLQPDKKSGQQYTHRRGECNIRHSYTLVFFFPLFFRQNSPQKRLQEEEEEEECESLRKCRSSTRCNRTANVLTRGRGQALCERGVHERTQSDFVIIHTT